ncbi:SusD/RagB family nutrient-binding outer membrane lipoprotein [Sphingobacterium sp. DR205]|nr:SusD/RagB family nutrient-binding outer membrane lipoprotein [Sphingobacterium sp. DR205]
MKTKYSFILFMVLFGLVGCTSNFDDLNTDPNKPTTVTSAMLCTQIILDNILPSSPWNSEFLSKKILSGEGIDSYQYNNLGKGSFGMIERLTNAKKMVELSSEKDLPAYTGVFYFLKAWTFYRHTLEMGDIPYSEALDIEKYRYPKYDEQKKVFEGILADLTLAENYFERADNFEGDPFYKGSPTLWRKATNVLRLKVLMSLQKRADDTEALKIKNQFAEIVGKHPLFSSNADNLQVVFSSIQGQENPMHESKWRAINTYAATITMIQPLKERSDYRLFYYFAPMQAVTEKDYLIPGGTLLERNDWNAYNGVDPSDPSASIYNKISIKMFNRVNDVYRTSFEGVPFIRLGYADMNFILAEAAEREWITGDPKSYYEEGIRASFDFVRTTVPNKIEYTQGMTISDEYIDSYLKNPKVIYNSNGTLDEHIEQIILQSYIASFFHLSWDSYFEYRRTGYPKLPINPETNLNEVKNKIPSRWLYPQSEINYNKKEMSIALDRQWGGVDNINNSMWILK